MAGDVHIKYQTEDEGLGDVTAQEIAALERLYDVFKALKSAEESHNKEASRTEKELTAIGRVSKTVTARVKGAGAAFKSNFNPALATVAKLGAAAVATLGALTAGTIALSQAGSEQDAVFARLGGALRARISDADELEAAWSTMQASIGEQAGRTDFGDEELSNAAVVLQQLTGDYQAAAAGLGTVADVSVATGKSLEESSKIVGKALKGDVEALRELTPLTREQAAALAKETDASKRAAAANDILKASFAGAATTAGTARGVIKELDDAKGDLAQQMGRVVNQAGLVQAILGPVGEGMREMEAAAGENSVQLQHLALMAGDHLVTALELAIEAGAFAVDSFYALKAGVSASASGLEGLISMAEISARGLASLSNDVLAGLLERLEGGAELAERMAQAVGADGLAARIGQARASVADLRGGIEELEQSNLAGIREEMESLERSGQEIAGAMGEYQAASQRVLEVKTKLREGTDGMRNGIARARLEVEPLKNGLEQSAKSGGQVAAAMEQTAAAAKATADDVDAYVGQRAELLRLERQILEAEAAGRLEHVARLTLVKSTKEAALAYLESERDQVAELERANALRRAGLESQRALAELARAAADRSLAESVAALRIDALEAETDLERALLEIQIERKQLAADPDLGPQERRLRTLQIGRRETEAWEAAAAKARAEMDRLVERAATVPAGLARGLGAADGIDAERDAQRIAELEALKTEAGKRQADQLREQIALEQQRREGLAATADQIGTVIAAMHTLADVSWDTAEGQDAALSAMQALSIAGAQASKLAGKDRADFAAIEAGIQAGLAIAATAAFISSGGVAVQYAAAAVEHTAAAVSLGVAASKGGSSSPSARGGASSAPAVPSSTRAPETTSRNSSAAVDRGFDRLVDSLAGGGSGGATHHHHYDLTDAWIASNSARGRREAFELVRPELEREGAIARKRGSGL